MSVPRRIVTLLGVLIVLLVGCSEENVPDAHGNFEAEEVTVSAQAGGNRDYRIAWITFRTSSDSAERSCDRMPLTAESGA